VPVAIAGTADALPLGHIVPRRRHVTVFIGEPIVVPPNDRAALAEAGERAASQIRALLGRA